MVGKLYVTSMIQTKTTLHSTCIIALKYMHTILVLYYSACGSLRFFINGLMRVLWFYLSISRTLHHSNIKRSEAKASRRMKTQRKYRDVYSCNGSV